MLSRLSGLANTVLQELSGEGEDAEAAALQAGPEIETSQQNGEETPEDVLERLAHMERLVAQLKELVREKEAQLQQKDVLLQEEKQAADAKLLKLKLQAKAKLASLNKRIEELTEQGEAPTAKGPARTSLPPDKGQRDQETHEEEEGEAEGLQRRLQEQEEMVVKLQEKLDEATGALSQAQSQLSFLQEELVRKDASIEEQARQHQAELQQLMAQSALEAGMQQDLKLLQRTLEEQEVALMGRMQVVELLQHELNSSQEEKQILLEKFQKAEAELDTLRSTLASERQESRSLVERLELELAEQKLVSHRLQEEAQQIAQELAQARAVQADRDRQGQAAGMVKEDQEMAGPHDREAHLECGHLQQNTHQPPGSGSSQKGELSEGPEGSSCPLAEIPPGEEVEQVSVPCESFAGQGTAARGNRVGQQEEWHRKQSVVEATAPGNEPLCKVAAQDDAAEGKQGADAEPQAQPALGQLLDLSLCSSGPDVLDPVGLNGAEGLLSPDVSASLNQPSQDGSAENLLDTEEGQPDVLEYFALKKQKDLSTLLLELQEAQEEIAFLKGQLQDPKNVDTAAAGEPGGQQIGGEAENGEEGTELIQSGLSSSSLITIEIQEESLLPGTSLGQDSLSTKDKEPTQGHVQDTLLDSEELAKLHLEITELRTSHLAAEALYKSLLEERTAEVKRLQQLVEDSGRTMHTLSTERDQLLSQLQELCSLAELKEQVKQLEGSLADAEKQRLSDYESGTTQLGLLKEQIQSLKNEAKSKEVKIAALQKDLDEAQHLLSEQSLLGKSLSSQLEKEEQETRAMAERLRETLAKVAELSEDLLLKETEAAGLRQLLSESSAEVERLQQEVVEREEQAAEISLGMTNRMVQLNEEKLLLRKELKNLTEQLSLHVQDKETREAGVGTEEEPQLPPLSPPPPPPPSSKAEAATLPVNEEIAQLKRENDQVRKKLQAALISRKELLSKVRRLEKELEGGRGGPEKPQAIALEIQGYKGEAGSPKGSVERKSAIPPAKRGRAASLGQLLSVEEAALQDCLKKEDPTGVALQAVIQGLQQRLQEKDLLIAALQAQMKDHPLATEKQALVDQISEVSEVAAPSTQVGSSGAGKNLDEEARSALAEKIDMLEQDREQLQEQLQEAVASLEEALKKAEEKDHCHGEQLKQQQQNYNILQEQFEEQRKEKEMLHAELQALRETQEKSLLESTTSAPPEIPPLETKEEPTREASAEGDAASSRSQASEAIVEQLEAELQKLQAEKGELEAQVNHVKVELQKKSEVAVERQEQIKQLFAELNVAKAACDEAEAHVVDLQRDLEERQAEIARLENLRVQQLSLEEQNKLASQEKVKSLNSQLADKDESLHSLQEELQEKEKAIKTLQEQLEVQSKEQTQQVQQKSSDGMSEEHPKSHLQRKLQAALISRKEALKESKMLREELASTKVALQSASLRLSEAETQASELGKEKEALLEKLAALQEERDKLIAEVDKSLVENQNFSGSCESLKLALEGLTQEKVRLKEEMASLQRSQAQELSVWQEKHEELQKEYETLLQSYENVSNEAERIQRMVEGVRQEKQELFLRLKGVEAEKREADGRLQGVEQEMEGMREKMRKFAKSKQQKILELEEENERLRTELHPVDPGLGRTEGTLAGLREELESSKKDNASLSSQLEALVAEKASLTQQIQDLKQKLQCRVDKVGRAGGQEEVVSPVEEPLEQAEAQARVGTTPEPPESATVSPPTKEEEVSKDEINSYIQQVAELEEKRRIAAEELSRVLRDVETLGEEKKTLQDLLAPKDQELDALREKVIKLEEANNQMEELHAEAVKLKAAVESEKDDLEERLMNQLAELNGSIGNYQQDMAELQRRNQELVGEVAGLQETLNLLEVEQQNLRKKVEAEAVKKEQVEKLRSPWKDGSCRTQAKELQELLKAKQQEVRQLQKDCIKSQERISSLERTIKALEFVQSESQKDLEATKKSLAKAEDDARRAQADLASFRVLLDDTQSEAARVLAESLKAREELQVNQAKVKAQLKEKEKELGRRLELEKDKHLKEMRNMEERLEALQREQARSEEAAQELQNSLRQKDREAKELQSNLNHTLAQLAAFTRSMSSLQDDRDRVIDESRQWEKRFSETIAKKEQEVLCREQACTGLEKQTKEMAAQVEELQSRVTSLEHSKLAQESQFQKELLCRQEEAEAVQEEKNKLLLQLEEAQQLLKDAENQVQKQKVELQDLKVQLADLRDSFAKCDKSREETEKVARSQEVSLQECKFRCEQLGADLQASKRLTDQLHEELSGKDHEIISLMAAKEEAVSAAVSELQQLQKDELRSLEDRMGKLEEARAALEAEKLKALEKVDHLTGKLKSSREESRQHKAQLDSFTKSMSSLQDDRDRILGEYRQLEQRHLTAILEKDQLIQEAATENNTLKEELRSLHSRIDDLHAENAKLDAELVRYREDLHQLISIKDCQQKELLGTQLQRIQALEQEKASMESQLKESGLISANLQKSLEDLKLERNSVEKEMEALRTSLSQMQNEMAALHEGGPMLELQAQLQAKVDEAQELSNQLVLQEQEVVELKKELALLRQSTTEKMNEAEAKMKKELKNLHHDAGLMRNETETAEERVAELARDLLEMEQNLLAVTEENQDLKAQIQSFGKAMSSLQDSWDQSNDALHAMEKKYSEDLEEQRLLIQQLGEEKALLQEEQTNLAKQRDALVSDLGALQKQVEEKGLLLQLDQVRQQLQSKDAEVVRLTSEMEEASNQVKSFSKAMASLQGERDRLLGELDKARKVSELKLQSEAGVSAHTAEVAGLKKSLSSLQNDRDRLVSELKNLQQQYLKVNADAAEVGCLRTQLQKQEAEQQHLLEQMKEESASWQLELQQLREEKAAWQLEAYSAKDQKQGAATEKRTTGTGIVEKQSLAQAAAEVADSRRTLKAGQEGDAGQLQAQLKSTLKELHQKEMRIQQLNSKLSQVFEEKNSLSLQLRGSSRHLRESHQSYSEALARCEALEKQLQALQPPGKDAGSLPTDAAPGAPQERNEPPRESYTPELQELQMRLLEAKQQQSSAKQSLRHLEEMLQEEQERRLAAEEVLAAAQDHMQRLEASDWPQSLDTSIEIPTSAEHALLIAPAEGSFSKARGRVGLQRILRSLMCSRRRLPLLGMLYLLAVHVLLFLCFTGRL